MQENIIIKGQVSEDEKIKLIKESTALVNPSLVEGFGMVILESFCCKRPVIVSNIEPLSDLVSDSDGFVVKSTEPSGWAEKILELMSNPPLAMKMGQSGMEKINTQYSASKNVDDVIAMYHNIINSK